MAYETLKVRLTGTAPLIMHNGDLADPDYQWTKALKAITGKRKKTEDDFREMARLEYIGSLYMVDGRGPVIPARMIEACIMGRGGAASKMRMTPTAKAGLFVDGDFSLDYDGPRDPEELWDDGEYVLKAGVRVQQSRIIRTRPLFRDWSAEIEVNYNPRIIDRANVIELLQRAGEEIGIGDWRPKYGRFEVTVLD